MTDKREFDVVIYGATGFTGKLAAQYYAQHVPRSEVNWALAGRSLLKLDQVRKTLGSGFADLPLLVADSEDMPALREMTSKTHVVQSTVGPYARYGEGLVRACVETGTDYLDITGESPWVRHLIDTYHSRADRKAVRIINCCGFDSIPSDITTYFLARETQRQLGEGLSSVLGLFSLRGGGLNGGTLASMLNLAEGEQLEQLSRPYLLNPGEEQIRSKPADRTGIRWDPDWWVWTAPFFMAPVNTRVVRRSESLYRHAGQPYGPDFVYEEALWLNELLPTASLAVAGASLAMEELIRIPAMVQILKKFGPKPGEGPSEAIMEKSSVSCWFRGRTSSGKKVKAHFFCQGDPGNRVTVKLLCESALTLVHARERLPQAYQGGVLTPALALGDPLVQRLRAADVTLQFVSD